MILQFIYIWQDSVWCETCCCHKATEARNPNLLHALVKGTSHAVDRALDLVNFVFCCLCYYRHTCTCHEERLGVFGWGNWYKRGEQLLKAQGIT